MRFPAPPWAFPQARVLYQPTFVRADDAHAAMPGPSSGLTLLSLFGWTLGGVFIVEWTESPIGSYREVAVLSSLVWNDGRLGAWASNIFVTTPDAVDAGRDVFGLSTRLGSISTDLGPEQGETVYFGEDDSVSLGCWDGWIEEPGADGDSSRQEWGLNLPSFSGCLQQGDSTSPLLRYPLRLGAARRASLRSPLSVSAAPGLAPPLSSLLGGPAAFPCIQLDGVDIVAGAPEQVPVEATVTAPVPPFLELWRSMKAVWPRGLTGAAGSDGDDDPNAALFNLFLIRIPFIAGMGALTLNVLLGGGVTLGATEWPPAGQGVVLTPGWWVLLGDALMSLGGQGGA